MYKKCQIKERSSTGRKIITGLAAVLCCSALASQAQLGTELMPNVGFKNLDQNGWALGWSKSANTRIKEDDAGRYLHINGSGGTQHNIALKSEYGRLRLSMKMKVVDVERGAESWETGRLTMSFHDADGKMVGSWPNVFGYIGTTAWMDCEREYVVPKGATALRLSTTNLGRSGEVMFRDISLTVSRFRALAPSDLPVPEGVADDPESLRGAFRLKTELREKICLNGLWRFRAIFDSETEGAVPGQGDSWGWFKVPGLWPEDEWEFGRAVQQVFWDPWVEENIERQPFDQAWYKRTFKIPEDWKDRRIALEFTMLQTHAQAYVDGESTGSLWFPGGELDLTDHLVPGKTHELALKVTARPIAKDKLTFMAADRAFKDKARVKFKGITGDLFLSSMPRAKRLIDLHVITSVAKRSVVFATETKGLKRGEKYVLKAVVNGCDQPERVFTSAPTALDSDDKLSFESEWGDARLWDTRAPENLYSVTLWLCAEDGSLIDVLTPITFGFREYRINGRDFVLNEIPIHLRFLYNRSTISKADISNLAVSRAMCRRMFEYGFNALIFGNYDFAPGSVAYMDGILNACDREGMLISCSLPHIKDMGDMEDAETAERYRKLTEWVIRRVRNHPSVIMYAMNHNYCGYYGDQNPLKIDGKYEFQVEEGAGNKWRKRRRGGAMIADGIVHSLDRSRPAYHHQSGNLGDMHTVNIYLNWAPIQERDEWLRHWATEGVKPLFFVEWGLPHISSWSSYRGPQFIWRAEAFQSLWAAEYAAQFWGDEAYRDDAAAIRGLDHEEMLWAKGKPFYWSALLGPLRDMTENYLGVQALFANENWRSHRAWGISAMLPWDQDGIWKEIVKGDFKSNPDAFKNLKQPGVVADYHGANSCFLYAMEQTDSERRFAPTPLGETFLRWNMADCAFIGGGENFTAKDHAYAPGESVRKNLIILNDRRVDQSVAWHWRLRHKGAVIKERRGRVAVGAGSQARLPIDFVIPDRLRDGAYLNLAAVFNFEDGVIQNDQFGIDVIEKAGAPKLTKTICLYDTKGLTAKLFDRLKIKYSDFDRSQRIESNSILAIGRESLTKEGLAWISSMADGAHVIVFEQSSAVLEGLLGFRIAERGMRTLFPRYPHVVTELVKTADFRDWRGKSTLLPQFLEGLPRCEERDPIWRWCGMDCTRVWRCGNQGSAASVVIEKPQRGDWRALLDCGFDLRYSPLLECVAPRRRVVFCQLDVTGRTEVEPVADRLVVNLLTYLDRTNIEPAASVKALGDKAESLMNALGVNLADGALGFNDLLVVDASAQPPDNLREMIREGLKVLCFDMAADQLAAWSPVAIKGVSTNACFTRIEKVTGELKGLCNADWAWHGRMNYVAVFADDENNCHGNDALRIVRDGKGCVVFCQVPPWSVDADAKPYLRASKRAAYRLVARVLANLGAAFETPLENRFAQPIEKAWLRSYYIDVPVVEDEPYRYYRW